MTIWVVSVRDILAEEWDLVTVALLEVALPS
jgi:hypothetical protein